MLLNVVLLQIQLTSSLEISPQCDTIKAIYQSSSSGESCCSGAITSGTITCDESELEFTKMFHHWSLRTEYRADTGLANDVRVFAPNDKNKMVRAKFPLIVWSHGGGNSIQNIWGHAKSDMELAEIMDIEGPLAQVKARRFARKWMMVAPQSQTLQVDPANVRAVIEYAIANFPVDENEIYLCGHSVGGAVVLQYLADYKADPKVKKVVSTAPYMQYWPEIYSWFDFNATGMFDYVSTKASFLSSGSTVPTWVFIAEDGWLSSVDNSIELAHAQNVNLTLLSTGGHGAPPSVVFSPDTTANVTIRNGSVAYSQDIYSWFMS